MCLVGSKVRGGSSACCQFLPAGRVEAVMLELLLCFRDCLQRWDGSCPSVKVFEDGGRVGRVLAMENGQCVSPRSPISGVAEKRGAGESKTSKV